MTRACYSLTLLLVALGGALLVTSPARCQPSFDYYQYGSCYHEMCPFQDGHVATHEEDIQSTQTDSALDEADLRGRAVVVVLDDLAAIETQDSAEVATAEPVELAPAAEIAATATATESDVPDMRDLTATTQSVNSPDVVTDVYDYVHHYDRAYGFTGPSGQPAAAEDVALDTSATDTDTDLEPIVERDYEYEVYQAYLQRCAEEAVAQALVAQRAEQVVEASSWDTYEPYEPYEPYAVDAAPSYDVYEYEHSYEPAKSVGTDSAIADEFAPCDPTAYGRHPYGYGYEHDYGYHSQYDMSGQPDESHESEVVESDNQWENDVLLWLDWGRDSFGSILESDLATTVLTELRRVWAEVAQVVEAMEFDRIGHDAAQALAGAVQQPQPAPEPDNWNEADVFLFTFDSDLNADSVTTVVEDENPRVAEKPAVEQQPLDVPNAATVAPAHESLDSAPLLIDRDQAIQWSRRAVDTMTAAWDRVAVMLRRVAAHSLAIVPSDGSSSTTQR